ncbi:beta strand repeat-containing protein [Arsenicibacter rosenii]|uniref:Ig-like domain-containing protein n=1 Tax=Arsenicibacter rosenii TaxID=1750698 RepID=A0A1S2VS27_9BACT|nr:hypothetical protein [Arsenicibacter rosenii]OIN60708.1 hypothetical protein BLX24_00925 [Arsenicibacter rosenii]
MKTQLKAPCPLLLFVVAGMVFMWLFTLPMASASPGKLYPDNEKGHPQRIKHTIDPAPTITISPASATYTVGQSVTVTVTNLTENNNYGFDIDDEENNIITYSSLFGNSGNLLALGSGVTSGTIVGTFDAFSVGSNRKINVYLQGGNVVVSTARFTIQAPPSLALVTKASIASVCIGNTVATLSVTATGGSTPYTYTWNAPSGASISGANNTSAISVNALTSGLKTFTVTVTGSDGSPVSSTISINVDNPTPIISPSTNLTFCEGSSLTLTSSGGNGITYLWSTGDTSASIVVSISKPYSLTITSPTGCTASATVTPYRYNRPTATVSALPGLTVCQGQSVTLNANVGGTPARIASAKAPPPVSYSWSTGSNTPSTIFTPTSNTVVSLTVNDGVCTSLPINTSIVVNPVSSVSITAAPSAIISCANPGVTLTASGSSGYTWDDNSTATTRTVSVSGVYSVSATGNGCSTTASVTVTGNSTTPTITITPTAAPILTVCAGSSLTLTANGAGSGGTYKWNTSETTQAISVSVTNTYSVTGTTASGCQSVTSVYFDVHSLPTATISALPALTVCPGKSVTLTASGLPGGLSPRIASTFSAPTVWYTWSTGSTDATAIFTPTSSTVISLTISDGACTGTTAATITAKESPTVSIGASATSLSGGQSATLTASGADSYTWSTGATSNPITVSPVSTTVYSVTGTRNGCVGVAVQPLSINCTDPISKAISATVVSVLGPGNCAVNIQGQGTGSSFVITGPNGYVFSTVYRRTGTYALSATGVRQPGTYTFTASATNACGQTSTDSITYVVAGTACP